MNKKKEYQLGIKILTTRKQRLIYYYVVQGDQQSKTLCGVLQGSMLDPRCFYAIKLNQLNMRK